MSLSKYWTNSISLPDDYSGGQSQKSSITQWGLDLFNFKNIGCDYTFFASEPNEQETTYEITIDIAGSSEIAFTRYLGCIIVGLMPDEGLEEALFSLRDMLQFYSHKVAPEFKRLPPKAIDATVTEKKKRPDLVIT